MYNVIEKEGVNERGWMIMLVGVVIIKNIDNGKFPCLMR